MSDPLQPQPILQSRLGDVPWRLPKGDRLPGTGPIEPGGWLIADDAFADQMRLRDRMLSERAENVHILRETARAAALELLAMALAELSGQDGYRVSDDRVRRPDGVEVPLDREQPLLTFGRLVQEDACLLLRQGDEHVFRGAVLCFPASWTLAEKIDRPLTGVHGPVEKYTTDIARRVQRLFDAVQPGRPLMRTNCLSYHEHELYQPRTEDDPREQFSGEGRYVRSERQVVMRLPSSGAAAFVIHTAVVDRRVLSAEDEAAFRRHLLQD